MMTADKYTIKEHFLDVGDGHQLYSQEWGNPKANLPIIFLHGGPGAGCNNGHKLMFDPKKERVIFFDQRGSGASLPAGKLEHNTTAELIEDIERIADYYNLDEFVITGGSWGSCLAFAYTLKYPKRVKGMVLRGIFTGSKDETDYIDNGGFKLFFPDVWQSYLDRTPKEFHNDPSAYHYKQIKSSDVETSRKSLYAYSELEGSLLTLDDRHQEENYTDFKPEAMAVELHYLENLCFMPDRYILENAHKITAPIWLVQGRYDCVCPPKTAYEIDKILPNSNLILVNAGHSGGDRSIYEVCRALLLEITNKK